MTVVLLSIFVSGSFVSCKNNKSVDETNATELNNNPTTDIIEYIDEEKYSSEEFIKEVLTPLGVNTSNMTLENTSMLYGTWNIAEVSSEFFYNWYIVLKSDGEASDNSIIPGYGDNVTLDDMKKETDRYFDISDSQLCTGKSWYSESKIFSSIPKGEISDTFEFLQI